MSFCFLSLLFLRGLLKSEMRERIKLFLLVQSHIAHIYILNCIQIQSAPTTVMGPRYYWAVENIVVDRPIRHVASLKEHKQQVQERWWLASRSIRLSVHRYLLFVRSSEIIYRILNVFSQDKNNLSSNTLIYINHFIFSVNEYINHSILSLTIISLRYCKMKSLRQVE